MRGGIEALDRLAIAFLEVADQLGIERARPRHPAFEEGELDLGKTLRHAAEEQRFANRLGARGEIADVVVDVVADRAARAPSVADRMKRRRDAQLAALRPHRVVVVFAVDAESIHPVGVFRGLGMMLRDIGNRALHVTRHHDGFQAKLADDIFELVDRFLRRMHRDHGGGRHPLFESGERVGLHPIERAARRAPHFVIGHLHRDEADGRIDDRIVEAHFLQPLVHQARKQRGGEVLGILRGNRPPGRAQRAALATLLHRAGSPQRVAEGIEHRGLIALGDFRSADRFQVIEEQRPDLDGVAIGVDNRMIQARAYLGRLRS